MNAPASLPENIQNEIGIYLDPGETVLKAISSTALKDEKSGQIWLVLTTRSIFFHTCELEKEPVIALLARDAIKKIDYFQRRNEIVLTFIPARNPHSTTRLSFGIDKQPQLEDFCEDLADLINFKKETAEGVKTYAVPAQPSNQMPELRNAVSATRHVERPDSPADLSTGTTVSNATHKHVSPPEKAEVKIVTQPGQSTENDKRLNTNSLYGFGYILAATLISVLVAFIWYKFFSMLSGRRK